MGVPPVMLGREVTCPLLPPRSAALWRALGMDGACRRACGTQRHPEAPREGSARHPGGGCNPAGGPSPTRGQTRSSRDPPQVRSKLTLPAAPRGVRHGTSPPGDQAGNQRPRHLPEAPHPQLGDAREGSLTPCPQRRGRGCRWAGTDKPLHVRPSPSETGETLGRKRRAWAAWGGQGPPERGPREAETAGPSPQEPPALAPQPAARR